MKFTTRFILFFLLLGQALIAQDLVYSKITTEDGLPSNEVYSLIKDKQGFIWGATDGGVFKYDGEQIKLFTTTDGLPDNTVLNLYEDGEGRIWMSTFNGRMAYIENNKIHTIAGNDSLVQKLRGGIVFSIQVSQDGILWLGSNRHLFKIAPQNNYQIVETIPYKEHSNILKEIEKGKIVGSREVNSENYTKEEKLEYVIDRKSSTKSFAFSNIYSGARSPNFKSIVMKDGSVLFNQDRSLIKIDANNRITKISFESIISTIYESEKGLWIGTMKTGVSFFESSNLNNKPKHYLKDMPIIALVEDDYKGLWFGTIGKGLLYCPSSQLIEFSNLKGLEEKIIALKTIDSNLYVMNESNLIFKLSNTGKLTQVYKPNENSLSEQTNMVHKNKELFFSGFFCGKMNLINNKISLFLFPEIKTGIGGTTLAISKNNSVFLLSYSRILEVKNNTVVAEYRLPLRGRALAIDSTDNLFLGTLNGLYQLKNKGFELIKDDSGLLSIRINHILCIGNYLLLSTNGNGLVIYNPTTQKTKHISKSDGLADDICSISVSVENEIWVGTKKGLSRIIFSDTNYESFTIYNYDSSDGLLSNEISNIDFLNNDAWIGTRKGLCVLKNYKTSINKTPPKIYIDDIEINQKPLKLDKTLTFNLAYNQNNLVFHLSNNCFKNTKRVKYQIQLKGFDSTFNYVSTSTVEYQNLPPGEYTFCVYGLNDKDFKNKNPIQVQIKIRPPFWKTWWFICVEIAILILIIYLIVWVRLRQIRKKEITELEINKRLVDFKLMALRAQMNPHFIFNSINAIQRYVIQNKAEVAYNYLTKFSKLIRKVLDNSNEHTITLNQELETLNLYVELELLRFENEFDYQLQMSQTIDADNIFVPGMLIQPFVENAIWHGIMPLNNIRKGLIKLNIEEQHGFLIIRVEDNGIGRKLSAKLNKNQHNHKSFGTYLSSERLELLYASKAEIEIINLENDKQEATGTLVEIKLPIKKNNEYE
jgi:ligand-binding sensor domain-containing protein